MQRRVVSTDRIVGLVVVSNTLGEPLCVEYC